MRYNSRLAVHRLIQNADSPIIQKESKIGKCYNEIAQRERRKIIHLAEHTNVCFAFVCVHLKREKNVKKRIDNKEKYWSISSRAQQQVKLDSAENQSKYSLADCSER